LVVTIGVFISISFPLAKDLISNFDNNEDAY